MKQYCLILAGGEGGRLWPVSRQSKPKQFLDIFGTGRTLLQQTYDRYAKFIDPKNIYVSTNVEYLSMVYEQLPQVDDAHILEEPLHRGTLASVAWGTVVISKEDPDANVIVAPADQLILQEDIFQKDVLSALDFVARNPRLMVMGIRPTRPETGYGYIQTESHVVEPNISKVKTFTEKPARQFAEMFVQDGGFLWNTGLFAFNVQTMLVAIYRLVPEYELEIPRMMDDAETADPKFLPEFFAVLPRLSMDQGVLEKSSDVFVYEGHFGWADLGTWGNIATASEKTDEKGNLMIHSEAIFDDCSGTVVCLPDGKKAVLEGLHDYVVAESDDVLLVCHKDSSTHRRLSRDAQMSIVREPAQEKN